MTGTFPERARRPISSRVNRATIYDLNTPVYASCRSGRVPSGYGGSCWYIGIRTFVRVVTAQDHPEGQAAEGAHLAARLVASVQVAHLVFDSTNSG